MRIKRIGVTACVVALVLYTALAVLPGVALADDTLQLPDQAFQKALIAAVGVDSNCDGKLTAAELANFSGSLDLHGKDISNLAGLGYMVSLKSLNLNNNNITTIPTEIKNCRELTSLDIGSNPVSALPAELTCLTKLATLKLSGTSLEALPIDMGKLTALETLDISSTSFTSLPIQIRDLPALTVLNASNLGLTSLPSWLGQCSGLQQLNLDSNGLSAVPDLSGLTNLTVLKLNSNDFSALPQQITVLAGLQCLELRYNRLNTLGANVNLLTSLEALRLSGNALDQLPSEIGSLTKLTTLELDSNSLSALPASLGNLSHLQVLNLSGNRLSDLPTGVFAGMSGLTQLNLNMNYLNPTPGSADLVEINKASGQKLYSDQVSFTLINGNDAAELPHECYQGETVSLPPPVPQNIPAGKSFVGWDLNGDGNAETDEQGNGVFVAQNFQNISVTYNWVLADNGQAVVAFRAGDHGRVDGSTGIVRMLTSGRIDGDVPKVQADEGYRFAGWRRSSDNALFLKPEDVLALTFDASDEFTAEYADNSANLGALNATVGELSPAFYPYSYSYVLIVPDSAPDTGTTTLTASAQGVGATLTMDGAASPLSVNVTKGQSKTISIIVTAPDGVTQKTYSVKVVHADKSGAALSSLDLSSDSESAGTAEPFNPTTTEYHVNLSPEDDTLHIQTTAASGAVIAFRTREGGSFVPSATGTLDFNVSAGVNFTVWVRVTSPDGYSQTVYTLNIVRERSTDCTLGDIHGSLALSGGAQSGDKTSYAMQLPESTADATIYFTKNYRYAKVIVENATPVGDTVPLTLETGETRIVDITVIAQDGMTSKTYEVTVSRDKSSNANLGTLTLDTGILGQAVSAETTSYTAFIPYDRGIVTINAGSQNKYGLVSLDDSGSNLSVAIANGQTITVPIVVTAQNGSTRNYSLQLTRETPVDLSLSELNVAGVTLSPGFSAGNLSYTVQMSADMAALPISVKCADDRASVSIASVAGYGALVPVPAGQRVSIQIVVTSPQGATTRTYTITATRAPAVKFIGSFPANKLPAKANAGTALTITPQKAPSGYKFKSISFSSSKSSLATVDPNGKVTFVAGGKPTITVTMVFQKVDKKGKVTTKKVTVKKAITVLQPVSSITFSQPAYSVIKTKSLKLNPKILPNTASNKKVKWTSSNPRVASVSSSGVVLGKAAGQAVISCTSQDGSKITARCIITVLPIHTQSIKLAKKTLTIKVGKTGVLKATVNPGNSDFKKVTWKSDNTLIATVNVNTGNIKGIAKGTVRIIATTADGKSASCYVTIN